MVKDLFKFPIQIPPKAIEAYYLTSSVFSSLFWIKFKIFLKIVSLSQRFLYFPTSHNVNKEIYLISN